MQYKLHLNLQQRAALKTAISFWEKKEVQNKVTEFFETCNKFQKYETRYKWCEFTKTVVDEWNKDLLPRNLEIELIHIIKMIGETIFNWFLYIKDEHGAEEEAINCIDKIHWTPYGTLDIVKIFKIYWLDNPNFDTTKLLHFACSHMLNEHINDLWPKISQDIEVNNFFEMCMSFNRHILAYWKGCRDNDLINLLRYFEESVDYFNRHDREVFNLIYDLDSSLEQNMLRLSVHEGYFIAVKYFWEKINEEERNDSVLKCARIAVMRYHYDNRESQSIGGYKKNQYIEICIFLMNQMNKDHKKAFFNEKIVFDVSNASFMDKVDVKDDILSMLLSTWPWQELFMPVLNDMLQYQDENSRMACMFLDTIAQGMYEVHDLNYSVKTSKYQNLLREVWIIIPASIKQKIVQNDQCFNFISYLIDVWDMDSLKLILDDPAMAVDRDEFIDSAYESYQELIINDQFEKLEQFMDEFFKSEEEKKRFKHKIDIWQRLVLRNRFDLADKMLDWLCSTPEERQSVKKSIDHIQICDVIIGFSEDDLDYDLLNEFLDWKFDTEEEKKNCKNYFRCDEVFIMQVFTIWNSNRNNVEKAKRESSLFLHWLLEPNEKIAHFKKRIFINFDTNQLMRYFNDFYRSGNLRDFLIWGFSDDAEV